jgi:hypothetical protein
MDVEDALAFSDSIPTEQNWYSKVCGTAELFSGQAFRCIVKEKHICLNLFPCFQYNFFEADSSFARPFCALQQGHKLIGK